MKLDVAVAELKGVRVALAYAPPAWSRLTLAHRTTSFPAVRVPRLVIYDPRFLPTVDYSCAVAFHFAHCGQLAAGLAPAGVCPCWAHEKKKASSAAGLTH
jgi:hypothetical protein